MVYLGDAIDVSLAPVVSAFCEKVKSVRNDIVEVVPSYTSVLVEVRGCLSDVKGFESDLLECAQSAFDEQNSNEGNDGEVLILSVCYDRAVAPDLESLAKVKCLTESELIAIHSGREYTVCAIGFAPGFAFLAEVDERIAHARHAEPRRKVMAGSVGIADSQTAVYPQDSPGGWQIIGNCPVNLFDLEADPVTPFKVGCNVKLEPISLDEYLQKGGELWNE